MSCFLLILILFVVRTLEFMNLKCPSSLSALRFNEWGKALWALQFKFLRTPAKFDWRYLAYFTSDDADNNGLPEMKNSIVGQMMKVLDLALKTNNLSHQS